MKLPYSLHILVSLVTWGFIAVSLIILITQSSFGYLIYEDSMYIDGSVVSPFDSILEKYSPKSLKPCSYPGLIKPYNNTFLCDCKYVYYNQISFSNFPQFLIQIPPFTVQIIMLVQFIKETK